jgi:hypothetical protein
MNEENNRQKVAHENSIWFRWFKFKYVFQSDIEDYWSISTRLRNIEELEEIKVQADYHQKYCRDWMQLTPKFCEIFYSYYSTLK